MVKRRALLGAGAAWAAAPLVARAARSPLRMAYFETYSPFSFRADDGRLRGLLPDVIDEVCRRMELPVQHTGYPWLRAQALVQAGEADGICTIATPGRLAYALPSQEPVVSVARRIFVRADNPMLVQLQQVHDLADLRQLTPRVVSYAGNGWGAEHLGPFQVESGRDFDSALKMLVAKRGDLMVETAYAMQYSLKRTRGGDAVIMLPQALDTAHFQLLLGKQSPQVEALGAFDKTLGALKKTAAYAEVFARYGVKP